MPDWTSWHGSEIKQAKGTLKDLGHVIMLKGRTSLSPLCWSKTLFPVIALVLQTGSAGLWRAGTGWTQETSNDHFPPLRMDWHHFLTTWAYDWMTHYYVMFDALFGSGLGVRLGVVFPPPARRTDCFDFCVSGRLSKDWGSIKDMEKEQYATG